MVKKKTKVILKIAKNFLAYHPQKGKPTNFEAKIKAKDKLHTIRPNYEAWKKKIEKVKNGESELIVEQWSGLPYRSSPELLFIYDEKDEVEIEVNLNGKFWQKDDRSGIFLKLNGQNIMKK